MPDYKDNALQGWQGDWGRGAPLGRPTVKPADSRDHGRITLRRIPISAQGYDSQGTYWGQGRPLYWAATEDGALDMTFRASSREEAKAKVRETLPGARFYR